MSTPEVEALLAEAIAHVNDGDLEQGRALLERVLEQDRQNDRAWVWLSGCVEDPRHRRVCLQQALNANPNNQAALDGMQALEGKLVQASQVPPSLLESRLSAIGMGEQAATEGPSPPVAPAPSPEAAVISPTVPAPTDLVEGQATAPTRKRSRPGRVLLLIAAVLLLFILICALVAVVVLPRLLETLPLP